MGYTSTRAQLLTAPPYTCGAIAAVLSAYFADRVTWRMPFIVASQSILVVAYSVLFVFAPNIANKCCTLKATHLTSFGRSCTSITICWLFIFSPPLV